MKDTAETTQETENPLEKDFTKQEIIQFSLPTICMMIFLAAYPLADGVVVANHVSENALAAISIATPLISIMMGLALMIASGGGAIVGKLLGEKREEEARGFLTFLYLLVAVTALLLTLICTLFSREIALLLGASQALLDYTQAYIHAFFSLCAMGLLQGLGVSFMITVGKSGLIFFASILGGITNVVLDYVFIAKLDMGIAGAGYATGIGYSIPALVGFFYFLCNRNCVLHFVKPEWKKADVFATFSNGISEFVNYVSSSITNFLFNLILLRIAGEAGVAAITIIMQVQFVQIAIYSGYSLAVFPLISYKYGAQNHNQLKLIVKTSYQVMMATSLFVVAGSWLFAEQAVGIFLDSGSETFALTVIAFRIYSLNYIFRGVNIFASSQFTALSDGKTSGIISLFNSLILILISLWILPQTPLGIWGVWLAVPLSQCLGVFISYHYYKKYQTTYHY